MKSRESVGEFTSRSSTNVCPTCTGSLTVHQPDPDLPNRLLGVCHDCKSWFFLGARKKAVQLLIAFGKHYAKVGDL
jgi:hypothetical protein